MKLWTSFIVVILLMVPTLAQDAKEMEAWMKAATPTSHHAHLNQMAGYWKVSLKYWMDAKSQPIQTQGISHKAMILGGRYLKEDYSSRDAGWGGTPFQGMGLTGYNNITKKYTSIWTDTMSTAISPSSGTCDKEGKTFTFVDQTDNPITGKTDKGKTTIIVNNKNQHVLSMYRTVAGKEIKHMEIVYYRIKKKDYLTVKRQKNLYGKVASFSKTYHNLITDIKTAQLAKIGAKVGDKVRLKIGGKFYTASYIAKYKDVAKGKYFIIDRDGVVTFGLQSGNAQKTTKAKKGNHVIIFK